MHLSKKRARRNHSTHKQNSTGVLTNRYLCSKFTGEHLHRRRILIKLHFNLL